MKITPDLSGFKGAFPKPSKRLKKSKVQKWDEGRSKLKAQFKDYGVTECEAKLAKCTPKNFLGFAHIKRRNNLTEEETVDPHFVILACNPCHEQLDFKMARQASELLMETIIKARGW